MLLIDKWAGDEDMKIDWVLCCIVLSVLFGACMYLLVIIAYGYYLGYWRFII